MRSRRIFYLVTLCSTALFVYLQLLDPPVIRDHVEGKTYDLRLILRNRLLGQAPPPADIVIVIVDEKSIREMGRWPWNRGTQAALVNAISADSPRVIGMDIMYTEPESAEADGKLAAAIGKAGNVVLATPFFPKGEDKGLPPSAETQDALWDSALTVKTVLGIAWKNLAAEMGGVNLPVPALSKAAALGSAYAITDMDGVIRWEPLYVTFGDDCYPDFALQVARISMGLRMDDMLVYGGSAVKMGDRLIPVDIHGKVLINYSGGPGSFTHLSASDVLSGRTRPGFFQGKIVLVGTSALATYDQKVTPLSGNLPGVEKNADVVRNILANDFLQPSHYAIEMVVILMTGLLLGILLPRLKALPGATLAFTFIFGYAALGCGLLFYRGLVISLVYPLANMTGIFIFQTIARFFFEERKSREIRRVFTNYVSPKIVHELIEHPEKARLGGERREVTILFSDVIGFTSFSEKRPPEEVVSMLNEYFAAMTEVIFKWDGTLDKFVGDEIMIFWGAPAEQPDHAELAVGCALEMSRRLTEMQEEWRRKGVEGLDCGIGINTGHVLIGNIGTPGRKMDYTAIGDHVNLAARVEKLTRQYGSRILLAENTALRIERAVQEGRFGQINMREVDSVKVKGKEQSVRIFSIASM